MDYIVYLKTEVVMVLILLSFGLLLEFVVKVKLMLRYNQVNADSMSVSGVMVITA